MIDRNLLGPEEYEWLKRRRRLLRIWLPFLVAATVSLVIVHWASRSLFSVAPGSSQVPPPGGSPAGNKSRNGPGAPVQRATKTEGGQKKTYRAYTAPDGTVRIVVEDVEEVK